MRGGTSAAGEKGEKVKRRRKRAGGKGTEQGRVERRYTYVGGGLQHGGYIIAASEGGRGRIRASGSERSAMPVPALPRQPLQPLARPVLRGMRHSPANFPYQVSARADPRGMTARYGRQRGLSSTLAGCSRD